MTPRATDDVVFGLSFETWDDMVRREFARPPDRLAQHLMSAESVGRLLVVNPWRSVVGQLRRRVGHDTDDRFPTTDRQALVRPLRLRRGDVHRVAGVERSYRLYGTLVRSAARRRGLENPLMITFNPFFAAFGDHAGFSSVTYVARDDWASYHGTPHLRSAYLAAYERIRERGIAVSAVSAELLARLAPTGSSAVVPNGVDPGVWLDPRPVPADMAAMPRPIAVYTGTVDERLSLEAIESLARHFADGTVLLIGPSDTAAVARIRKVAPAITMLRSRKQSALAAYVHAADVCVLPHVVSDLTRAMSPLKVYEYLAAGAPVVATDLPPVRDVDADITLVSDLGEFGVAARTAAEGRRVPDVERRTFIANNTWSARCDSILALARSQPVSA